MNIRTVNIGPYILRADSETRPGQDILQNGWNYETHIRQELERLVPLSTRFLDIGANVGIHTVIAKVINPDIHIICVEVSSFNVELLCRNILENNLRNIIVIPSAIAKSCGIIQSNNDRANTSCSPCKEGFEVGYPNYIPSLTLDIFDLGIVDLIKIDIEGMEYAAWQGMTKIFANRPRMIFEFCPQLLDRSEITPKEQLQWLLDRGYSLTMLDYSQSGIRKTFLNADDFLVYMGQTTKWIADILVEPL